MAEASRIEAGGFRLRRGAAADHDRLLALQRAAYAVNRVMLGLEPIPLMADYRRVLCNGEVWLAEDGGRLIGALVLEAHDAHLLIESVATDPHVQGRGLGAALLAAAEQRARAQGLGAIRLYTGATLRHLVAWYARHGFELERTEALEDRSIAHMVKQL